MNRLGNFILVGVVATGGVLSVYAASPTGKMPGNSYCVYTKALNVDGSGVAVVPPEFQWSVETSWSGVDAQGNNLPDQRVMLRLYDPNHNFTALTAQMDLTTAAKLHQELGDIIGNKRRDQNFEHRPQLYDSKNIPTMRVIGVDKNGVAIVEEVPAAANLPPK